MSVGLCQETMTRESLAATAGRQVCREAQRSAAGMEGRIGSGRGSSTRGRAGEQASWALWAGDRAWTSTSTLPRVTVSLCHSPSSKPSVVCKQPNCKHPRGHHCAATSRLLSRLHLSGPTSLVRPSTSPRVASPTHSSPARQALHSTATTTSWPARQFLVRTTDGDDDQQRRRSTTIRPRRFLNLVLTGALAKCLWRFSHLCPTSLGSLLACCCCTAPALSVH